MRRSPPPTHLSGLLVTALALCSASAAPAQGSAADYERAANVRARYDHLLKRFDPYLRWLPDGEGVWWHRQEGGKSTYVRVDRAGRRTSSTPGPLGLPEGPVGLTPLPGWKPSAASSRRASIVFVNEFDRPVRLFWSDTGGSLHGYGEIAAGGERDMSTYVGHVFVLDFEADDLAGVFEAVPGSARAVIGERSRQIAMRRPKPESDGTKTEPRLRIRDHNVEWTPSGRSRNDPERLTDDGTSSDPYLDRFRESPDGRYALTFQRTAVEERRIPILEAVPERSADADEAPYDDIQPRLRWQDYRKPGDAIPQSRPRLFDLQRGRAIPIDDALFADSFSVGRVHWAPDSSAVYCLYNERGHQRLVLFRIEARNGKVTPIIDETSETFVDYSQKTSLHWLEADAQKRFPQVLWTSERDGNNHLYRFDAKNGRLLRQITKGSFRVRKVLHVDEESRRIWFLAMGLAEGQSPYHQHLARVDFDGNDLVLLTESDGNHTIEWSEDRALFVDRWSRPDQPQVTELRDAVTGKLLAELGRDDPSELLEAGFTLPERFVAKGRDGTTDIHGLIYWPSTRTEGERYPVLDDVYAGPHDHHVPAGWHMGDRQRRLAELGFVVVRIDGQGTNWRSKAFHDVCWQNVMDGGIPDHIAWLHAAAATYPEIDLSRVGIFGGSAGGQTSLAAMLNQPEFYRAAVADCGCHDNRMDKIWWNEAWMGRFGPHYAANSNVTHAHKLEGALMLTVGSLDTNVDPASTMQVVDALIQAGKDFDLVVDPRGGHGIGESDYMARRRQDFFVRTLMGREPRW